MPYSSRPTDTGSRWPIGSHGPRQEQAHERTSAPRSTRQWRKNVDGVLCALAILGAPSIAAGQLAAVASPPGTSARLVGDSTQIRRALRKEVEEYQDYWRKAWQKVESKRHPHINLMNIRGWSVRSDGLIIPPTFDGLRLANDLTTELRRYLSILCYVDTPTDAQIELIKQRGTRMATSLRANTDSSDAADAARASAPSSRARGNTRAPATGALPAAAAALQSRNAGFEAPLNPRMAPGGLVDGTSAYTAARQIRPSPNFGSQCPQWVPPSEKWPLDEGEAIDLAIPPNEREALRRRRESLIRTLEIAQADNPKDEWISGQLVRFVLDQRSPNRASAAANSCVSSFAWCSTLSGLVQATSGDIELAERAYRSADSARVATASPTDTVRCTDPEISLLLPPSDRDALERAPCATRRALVDRMWWLADPLWSVPGNERFVAHKSRQIHATLRAALDRDERYIWARNGGGDAMREMIIRYGWPSYTYWPGVQLESEMSRVREDPSRPRLAYPPYTAKEYTSDRTALIPNSSAMRDPFSVSAASFKLSLPKGGNADLWWPSEHMMLWTKIEPMHEGQQALWRRDSAVVFSLAVDNALRDLDTAGRGPSPAALVGSTSPSDVRVLGRASLVAGMTLRLATRLSSSPVVLSAEIEGRTRRETAQRNRFGLRPPPTLLEMSRESAAMSDPVFMLVSSPGVVLPNNAETAMLFMAGSVEFSRNQSLALFWESYGIEASDSVSFELRINRNEELGITRRIGSALGVASNLRDSLSIRWSEPNALSNASVINAAKTIIGRSVAIDVKALPTGNYVVSLVMRSGSGAVVRGERKFVLRD